MSQLEVAPSRAGPNSSLARDVGSPSELDHVDRVTLVFEYRPRAEMHPVGKHAARQERSEFLDARVRHAGPPSMGEQRHEATPAIGPEADP